MNTYRHKHCQRQTDTDIRDTGTDTDLVTGTDTDPKTNTQTKIQKQTDDKIDIVTCTDTDTDPSAGTSIGSSADGRANTLLHHRKYILKFKSGKILHDILTCLQLHSGVYALACGKEQDGRSSGNVEENCSSKRQKRTRGIP